MKKLKSAASKPARKPRKLKQYNLPLIAAVVFCGLAFIGLIAFLYFDPPSQPLDTPHHHHTPVSDSPFE